MHVYVYYQVAPADAPALLPRVQSLQRALHDDCASARLMRRPDGDPPAPAQTWMEVYEDVRPEFDERLAAAVRHAALDGAAGPRHVERFDDLPARCA